MTNLKTTTMFPRSSFVGFDHLFNEFDSMMKQATDTYPPHNVVKLSEDDYQIEVALAGFSQHNLKIEQDNDTLTITGERNVDNREYLHKGISTKKFKRTFKLSEYVHVVGAHFLNGILTIHLKYELPEEKRPRTIEIK